MKIFVGCSSSNDIDKKYKEVCEKYLEELLKENDLVFGAYKQGLMEMAYNIALKNKRHITGICPKVYAKYVEELVLNKKIITNTINERTSKLIEESECIIFLPGGTGTMQELFTAVETKRGEEIDKPIIIYNCHNYFDETLKQLDKIYNEKFSEYKDCYHVSESIEDTLNYIKKRN
ncbi:MAG: LOG family protein [Bacilli bacterium]|nr:LOG family protein [Bacilli bacterium]